MKYCPKCQGDIEWRAGSTNHKCQCAGATEGLIARRSATTCSALVDALEALLPWHMMACVAHDGKQYFDNEDGTPLVTEESCQCGQKTKEYRKMLTAHKKSRKGFYPPNADVEAPNP